MEQLRTLSTKTDYTFVTDHYVGRPPSVSLAGPGVATYFLSIPETELLKLIKGLQDRCDKLEAALKYPDEGHVASAPTNPKLADMLLYLTRTDRASQDWWNGLSAVHQKNLVDCGFLYHLGVQDPDAGPAVPKSLEREAHIQATKLKPDEPYMAYYADGPRSPRKLAVDIFHYISLQPAYRSYWKGVPDSDQAKLILGLVDLLERLLKPADPS